MKKLIILCLIAVLSVSAFAANRILNEAQQQQVNDLCLNAARQSVADEKMDDARLIMTVTTLPLMNEMRALQLAPAFNSEAKDRLASMSAVYQQLVAQLWGNDPSKYTPIPKILEGLRANAEKIHYYGRLYEFFAPAQSLRDIITALEEQKSMEPRLVELQRYTHPPHSWFQAGNVEANSYLDYMFNMVYGPFYIKATADVVIPARLTQLKESINKEAKAGRARAFIKDVSTAVDAQKRLKNLADDMVNNRSSYVNDIEALCLDAVFSGRAAALKALEKAKASEKPAVINARLNDALEFAEAIRIVESDTIVDNSFDKTIASERKRAEKLFEKMADENRLPSDAYSGTDIEKQREQITAAFKARYPDYEVLKVTVTSDPWEKAEWYGDGRWKGWFQYIEAAVAYIDPKNEKYPCWGLQSNYRRQWSGMNYNTAPVHDFAHTHFPLRRKNVIPPSE